MSELNTTGLSTGELLVHWLRQLLGGDWFVGQVVPADCGNGCGWVYVNQTGEQAPEDLKVGDYKADSEFWAIEIISEDINSALDTSAMIKRELRNLKKYPMDFYGSIEFIDVNDSDDDYQFKSVPNDARLFGTALDTTLHLTGS